MTRHDWIPSKELAPSHQIDFALLEEIVISFLLTLLLMLMLYAGLRISRWKRAAREQTRITRVEIGNAPFRPATDWMAASTGEQIAIPETHLSVGTWLRVIFIGMALPTALYFLYTAIPQISGRNENILNGAFPFFTGLFLFVFWLLIVPWRLVESAIWRKHVNQGLFEPPARRAAIMQRKGARILALLWALITLCPLLRMPIWSLTALIAYPMRADWIYFAFSAVAIGLLLIPLASFPWERRHAHLAGHYIALSRALIPVYAVLILFTAGLYFVFNAKERYYMRQDHVMRTMRTSDEICFTYVEGRLVLKLQDDIRQGAVQCGLPWE